MGVACNFFFFFSFDFNALFKNAIRNLLINGVRVSKLHLTNVYAQRVSGIQLKNGKLPNILTTGTPETVQVAPVVSKINRTICATCAVQDIITLQHTTLPLFPVT